MNILAPQGRRSILETDAEGRVISTSHTAAIEAILDVNNFTKVGSPTIGSVSITMGVGTTPGSKSHIYTGPGLHLSSGLISTSFNWGKAIGFNVPVLPTSTPSTNAILRCILGAPDENAPSIRSIGFEVRAARIWLVGHDGTIAFAVDSGQDVTANQVTFIGVASDGIGNVALYVNNAQVAVSDAGPTASNGLGTFGFMLSITNGVDSVSTSYTYPRHLKLSVAI